MKEKETKTQNQPESKGKRVFKAILNTIINILIVVVLVVSILIAIMSLTSKSSGISTIFGYTVQPIQSDSMKGGSPDGYEGGNFEKGDLMIAKATGFDYEAKYDKGDIITFKSKDTEGNDVLISHRIVDVKDNDDGFTSYQTWGDNREVSEVPDQLNEEDYIHADDIGSVFYSEDQKGFIIKGFGGVIDFLKTQLGFFLVVLLPMIVFFLYALIRVVLSATDYKKAKAEDDKKAAVEAAVAAALAQKDTESAAQTPNNEAAAANMEGMSAEQMEQFKQFMEFQKMQKAQQEADNSTDNSSQE